MKQAQGYWKVVRYDYDQARRVTTFELHVEKEPLPVATCGMSDERMRVLHDFGGEQAICTEVAHLLSIESKLTKAEILDIVMRDCRFQRPA